MKLKATFNVQHTNQEEATGLLSLLDSYGIPYKQGLQERVPHPQERFVIPEIDYAVPWVVSFRVPEALRTDRTFVERLHQFCPLSEELDFEE
jgi:hypothetical protein